ncbi:MAG: hypothetical protein V4576_01335 [Patescibacteria group bacterium]
MSKTSQKMQLLAFLATHLDEAQCEGRGLANLVAAKQEGLEDLIRFINGYTSAEMQRDIRLDPAQFGFPPFAKRLVFIGVEPTRSKFYEPANFAAVVTTAIYTFSIKIPEEGVPMPKIFETLISAFDLIYSALIDDKKACYPVKANDLIQKHCGFHELSCILENLNRMPATFAQAVQGKIAYGLRDAIRNGNGIIMVPYIDFKAKAPALGWVGIEDVEFDQNSVALYNPALQFN